MADFAAVSQKPAAAQAVENQIPTPAGCVFARAAAPAQSYSAFGGDEPCRRENLGVAGPSRTLFAKMVTTRLDSAFFVCILALSHRIFLDSSPYAY
jgi:hypothetical protein